MQEMSKGSFAVVINGVEYGRPILLGYKTLVSNWDSLTACRTKSTSCYFHCGLQFRWLACQPPRRNAGSIASIAVMKGRSWAGGRALWRAACAGHHDVGESM